MSRRMNLILIEDNTADCIKFKNTAQLRFGNSVAIVGITNSSSEAVMLMDACSPDGVILDLELHKGEGSGVEFLKSIQDMSPKPVIVVTTNTPSDLLHNLVRDYDVAFIFYKRQKGYSPDAVISMLLDLWFVQGGEDIPEPDTLPNTNEINRESRIRERMREEMDLIGISVKHKGREYIEEAVYISVYEGISDSVFYQVAERVKVTYSSVIRSIQTAINNAWLSTDVESLSKHYTAPIDIRTGVPSPTELVRYYAEKISKSL